MTVIWLIVWLLSHTPQLSVEPMNDWMIALIACAAIDLMGR